MTVSVKQARVRHYTALSDALAFSQLLGANALFDTPAPNRFRKRLFPHDVTLSLFMAQALKTDRSCQGVVNEFAVKRLSAGSAPCCIRTGAYCKARLRLPQELVTNLVHRSGKAMSDAAATPWRWLNRPVKLIDGTTVTMPDTPANQARYPQQRNQKDGLGFPICRIVGVTCLASGAILNAKVGAYQGEGSGEQALLRTLLDSFTSGDVIVGDAFYATYFLLAELGRRHIDAVFQQYGSRRLSTDFRLGKKLGSRDHLIRLQKPKIRPQWLTREQYDAAPDSIVVRELDIHGRVLVTTLLCPKIATKAALKELYNRRWNIELDLRNIKTTMGMVTLSCKTPDMAEKEIWVYFLAYNLIRLAMLKSALLADVLPRSLSFKGAMQLWLAWASKQPTACGDDTVLLMLMATLTVGNRPGRIEPRAVKRRPKPYPLLTQARPIAREKVRKYGHPKKLK